MPPRRPVPTKGDTGRLVVIRRKLPSDGVTVDCDKAFLILWNGGSISAACHMNGWGQPHIQGYVPLDICLLTISSLSLCPITAFVLYRCLRQEIYVLWLKEGRQKVICAPYIYFAGLCRLQPFCYPQLLLHSRAYTFSPVVRQEVRNHHQFWPKQILSLAWCIHFWHWIEYKITWGKSSFAEKCP